MILHSVAIGIMYGCGFYLLMTRGWKGVVIGLALLSHATNLLLFSVGGLVRGAIPIVPEGLLAPPGSPPDPLIQALILTAVVISFGMVALALVMVSRVMGDEEESNP